MQGYSPPTAAAVVKSPFNVNPSSFTMLLFNYNVNDAARKKEPTEISTGKVKEPPALPPRDNEESSSSSHPEREASQGEHESSI